MNFLAWFSWVGPFFKAITGKFALIIYAVLAGLWLINSGIKLVRDMADDFKFDVQEQMRIEFNKQRTAETLAAQQRVLETIVQRNASQDEAMKNIIIANDARNSRYSALERKLQSGTNAAVAERGASEGPQPVSPYMDRALELLDENKPE